MVSRSIAAAGVALLILIAGCSGPMQTPGGTPVGATDGTAMASDGTAMATDGRATASDGTATTISVDATAEASAAPDLALVRVTVVSTAPDADTARERTAANVSEMRAALREAGIAGERIHTTYYNLDAVREEPREGGERERITGYRAAHGFEIEADVDAAGSVVDTAVANGANRVEGVTFTLTAETRRSLRREALGTAMAHARGDADAIANASGLSVAGVRSVSTSDFGVQPFDARVAEGGGGGASTVIDPGPVRVSATVSVTYRAEEA